MFKNSIQTPCTRTEGRRNIMKFIQKLLSFILSIFLLILIVLGIILWIHGYFSYQSIVKKIPISYKIELIKSQNDYTPINEINQSFLDAIYSTEDRRFYKHGAIDVIGLLRAMKNNILQNRFSEGGSTITQQLAKNMYFSHERKLSRKLPEYFIAQELEKQLSKDEILELYVNVIYFGDGYYGIKQASEGYFQKSPDKLNLDEATLLAGLPNAPSLLALSSHYERAKIRQKEVLYSMLENGLITQEEIHSVLQQ